MDHKASENTDRELWRERPGDYYADSLFVTRGGAIGMNVGGRVLVMPLQTWHRLGVSAGEELTFDSTEQLVLVESPLRGATASATVANQEYARRAMRDCLARMEAPFASHLLYAQPGILDDEVPAEREQGIAAGLAWGKRAARTVVYYDRGVSPGMRRGIAAARDAGREVVWRSLDQTPLVCDGVQNGDTVQVVA